MDQEQGIALVRNFVSGEFIARGMIEDINVHWDIGRDGEPQPHAHVILTMRGIADGTNDWEPGDASPFGPKVRDWNATAQLQQWRETWTEHTNTHLVELSIEARIDRRSYRDQEIALEPQDKISGPNLTDISASGSPTIPPP